MYEPMGHGRAEVNTSEDEARDARRSAPAADLAFRSAHVVQFYDDEAFLVETVTGFIGSGLTAGAAGIVIATKAHLDAIEERLRAYGVDTIAARAKGDYIPLDAAAALSLIMSDGEPDERRFHEVIGGVMANVAGGGRPVRAFGEMVALLSAAHEWDAALRLEDLWTKLGRRESFSLLCAYPMTDFRSADDGRPFLEVCSAHASVAPTEAYGSLQSATERLRLVAHLQQKAAALETALGERSDLLAREQAARAEAEAASRMKDEFLATLSHELRTPLNAILGWIRLLRTHRLDPTASDRAVEVIERNTQNLGALVSDILDVSGIITGKMALSVAEVDLAHVISVATDSVRPAADARRITVQSKIDSDIRPLAGDPARLQQIIWNLVANAVKFTPDGGRVEVRLESVKHGTRLSVADNGQGIAREFLPYVFDRFRQADSTASRPHTGLGLGLSIVRHLVELHGGTVRAESAGPGCGATFIVEFPFRQVYPAASESPARPTDPVERPLSLQSALKGRPILIIDDNGDTCELLAAVLREQGAEAVVATSVMEALAALGRVTPDLIVCDIAMPGTDGYEFIRHLRSRPAPADHHIPAVALTAYAQTEDRKHVLAAGFDAYITKPVEPAVFIQILAETIDRASRV